MCFGKTLNVLVIRLQRTWYELALLFIYLRIHTFFCSCFHAVSCHVGHPMNIIVAPSSASPVLLSWRPRSYGVSHSHFFIMTCPISSLWPVLSHVCTPFHFLKVPTHFCYLSIWQRSLIQQGPPLKAEAGSYWSESPSPAHTWEAGSKGFVSMGAGEVCPGTRVQLALNWLLNLKCLILICFLWDRINIL